MRMIREPMIAGQALLACACLMLSGCASSKLGGDPALKVVDAVQLPPPAAQDLVGTQRPYLVGPFDKLTIDVFGIEELSRKDMQVSASGCLSYPLTGALDVAGKSTEEIEQLITESLRARAVRDPQVTVAVSETVSQVVTVDGQVKTPGVYPVLGRMTLIGALARAGSTNEYTKTEDVILFRTVGGQKMAARFNLKEIRRGAYPDPEIYGQDIIVVGESKLRRLLQDVQMVSPLAWLAVQVTDGRR